MFVHVAVSVRLPSPRALRRNAYIYQGQFVRSTARENDAVSSTQMTSGCSEAAYDWLPVRYMRDAVKYIGLGQRGSHWLRISQCIHYKLCVLVCHQCVQGSARSYLKNSICPVASAKSRRRPAALRVIGRSHRGGNATYNNELPRRRRLSRLEQSARHKPSQLIEGATVLARASAKGASRERRRD